MFVTHLESALDGARFDANKLWTMHQGRPLWVRYDLPAIHRAVRPEDFAQRPPNLWRYRELLPLPKGAAPVTLGEGMSPLLPCPRLGRELSLPKLLVKDESQLPTGSFKVRGAVYAMSKHVERRGAGPVIAASTGNHGAAVAYAGRLLNVPVTIFLPKRANPVKSQRILDQGARIVAVGDDLSAAIDAAYAEAERTGAFFLHDATDADIPAGTATIGTEIIAQLPETDVIFVPMGDTALVRARGALSIWVTEDDRHLPVRAQLKVDIGTFDIKLKRVSYSDVERPN